MEPSNILKIETLNGGWTDKDIVMLHACFQLLTDCIEKENLLYGHTDWEYDEAHRQAKKEIEELFDWWKERVAEEQNENLNPIWTKNQHQKDTEMLIRLINVREYLWS